jgi:hypothetical protein
MESYCIDMHSRGGFSGSPVFAYCTAGGDLGIHPNVLGITQTFLVLLGISWGQFPEFWQITPEGGVAPHASQVEGYLIPGKYVKGLSGVTCVTPAWAILELIQHEKIQEFLRIEEAKVLSGQITEGPVPVPE